MRPRRIIGSVGSGRETQSKDGLTGGGGGGKRVTPAIAEGGGGSGFKRGSTRPRRSCSAVEGETRCCGERRGLMVTSGRDPVGCHTLIIIANIGIMLLGHARLGTSCILGLRRYDCDDSTARRFSVCWKLWGRYCDALCS